MFGIGKKKEKAEAPTTAPADSTVALQPAGFWLRVVAFIVDYAVLLLIGAAMMAGAASLLGSEMLGLAYWLWVLISFLYWPVLESTAMRATLGKAALGLVVADVDGGGLSFVRCLLRNLAKIISAIPFGIGYLLAAFTSRKQALHDLITKAVVLRKGASSFGKAIGVLVAGIALVALGGYLAGDYMTDAITKTMQEMQEMAGEAPAKPPAAVSKPAPKPAPAQVAKPETLPAPVPAVKPAAPAPIAQAPAPAAKPAAAPAPAAKPAPAPVAKPETALAAKPAPEKVAAAPKAPATEERKPVPLRAEPSSPPPAPVSPRFNDVMTAVLYGDLNSVAQLLDLGRWADKRDANGLTPLMLAVINGNAAMVKLLLERGADPDLQAPGGATAVDFARQRSDAATAQLLQSSRR